MAKKRGKGTQKPKFAQPQKPRDEAEILADILQLCSSPGFAHTIAYFCFRDNFVQFAGVVVPEDMAKLNSAERLIRTEIDTLIGLLIKRPIDFSIPKSATTQEYIDKTEALLLELHHSLASPWRKEFTPERIAAGFNPFEDGASNRRSGA